MCSCVSTVCLCCDGEAKDSIDIFENKKDQTVHKCPVCEGSGRISKPSWMVGENNINTQTIVPTFPCSACGGVGIVVI